MNEEYIKEYEEMSLCDFADELVEPLSTIKKDLTKIIYIHYAKERDKNYKLEEEKYKLILDSNGLINANGILQQELTKYKERCETLLDIIRYYKTTEWGLKSCEILDNFEEILEDKENKSEINNR